MKRSRCILGMISIVSVLSGAACGMAQESLTWSAETLSSQPEETGQTTLSPQEAKEQGRESILEENGYNYAYMNLTEAEQIWYRDIASILGIMAQGRKLSEEGLAQGLTENSVDKIFQAVMIDHPELFYVEGYSYTKFLVGEKLMSIEFTGTYNVSWEEACERQKEIAAGVEEILRAMPEAPDDYTKIRHVYDTLIRETDYDRNAPDNQNLYSVFVGHASVCQGYAKAFQYLMNRLNIDCTLVQGEVTESGEGHAWNLVRADGEFYYTDVTWGDISYRTQEEGETDPDETQQSPVIPDWISYDYFCITTKELLRTHRPDDTLTLPECSAVSDNYYVRENAFFAEYDETQLKALVNQRIEESLQTGKEDVIIALRCADRECYEEFCDRLLNTQELFRYLEGTGIETFIYSSEEKQYTLTFFLVTTA